jgi:hypothetical protein
MSGRNPIIGIQCAVLIEAISCPAIDPPGGPHARRIERRKKSSDRRAQNPKILLDKVRFGQDPESSSFPSFASVPRWDLQHALAFRQD